METISTVASGSQCVNDAQCEYEYHCQCWSISTFKIEFIIFAESKDIFRESKEVSFVNM